MKKITPKKLVVTKQVIRSLQDDALAGVVGGGTNANGVTCKCPPTGVCNVSMACAW